MTRETASKQNTAPRRKYKFSRASGLVQSRIRRATETRGFAQTRVLTHWKEIVGASIASVAQPVKIGYARDGFGATLTVLTTGAQAPMLEMQKEQIKEKVNACYGYNAISHIRITQTAATGFAEGKVAFEPAPKTETPVAPEIIEQANEVSQDVANGDLRDALKLLAQNVLSHSKP